MGVIRNESEVKKQSQFLEYEVGDSGNQLILKSHLYQLTTHFIQGVKRSVSCKESDCLYCAANYKKRGEYHYMVFLNGQTGFMDIKASVFFNIQGISKAQRKDPRQISWTVIKTGSGLDTEYTTSKDDNLAAEDYERLEEQLEENTEKLVDMMERKEEDLSENYTKYIADIKQQTDPKKARKAEAATEETSEPEVKKKTEIMAEPTLSEDEFPGDDNVPGDPSEEVSPDDIPF